MEAVAPSLPDDEASSSSGPFCVRFEGEDIYALIADRAMAMATRLDCHEAGGLGFAPEVMSQRPEVARTLDLHKLPGEGQSSLGDPIHPPAHLLHKSAEDDDACSDGSDSKSETTWSLGTAATLMDDGPASPQRRREGLVPLPSCWQCNYAFATLSLERNGRFELPVLRLTTCKQSVREESLVEALSVGHEFLAQGTPFLALYDVRSLTLPTRSQLKVIMSWVPEHSALLDTHLQGIAIVLSNSVVRWLVLSLLRVFKPPQPTVVVSTERAALDFFSASCKEVKPWGNLRKGGTSVLAPEPPHLRRGASLTHLPMAVVTADCQSSAVKSNDSKSHRRGMSWS